MMLWYATLFFVLRLQTNLIYGDYTRQCEQTSRVGGTSSGKMSKNVSKLKSSKSGHSSAFKSIKSKVHIIEYADFLNSWSPYRKLSQTLNVRMSLIYPPCNAKQNQT